MPQKAIDRFTYSRNGGGTVDERCLLRVNIHGATTQAQCTRYTIDVMNVQTRQTWQTSHRYSEFLALRNTLLTHFAKAERKCPGCVNFEKVIKLFEFPSKRYFTSKNNVVINYRKTALRAFLALLASHTFTTSPKCPTCSGVPFTAVRDFLTEEVATATSPTNSVGSGSGSSVERESIRESIQVKDFTTHVPPAKAKVVSSDGVFIRQGSTDSVGTSVKPAPAAPAKKTPKHKAPPQSPDLSLSASDSPKSAEKPVDLPPNESSGTSVSKSTSSLPPSPARVNVNSEQVRRNEDASFVSFSDRSDEGEDNTTKQTSQTQQTRRTSSKSRRNKKQGSSKKPFMEPQASMKLSEDDEFGSLNMDFLQSVSIAKE